MWLQYTDAVDRIQLLKPSKIDEASGYRYYREDQAIICIKFKNLQSANFTVDEIKVLLTKTNQEIVQVFDDKIKRNIAHYSRFDIQNN